MSLYISGINLADLAGVFRAQVIEQDGSKVVEFTAVDDPHYTLTGEITDVRPHGRLIEAEALKENWMLTELGNKVVEVCEIDAAPTVIEAEGEP